MLTGELGRLADVGVQVMQIDWPILIQIATLILFVTGWVTMYGNYRAGRAAGEALLSAVSKDTAELKDGQRRLETAVGGLSERMVRVETKIGLNDR